MLTVDGSEKTQLVPQKQRKNTCMTIILLLTIITIGAAAGGALYHGMINGGHVIDTAYGQASVPLVRNETAKLTASDGANYDYFGHSVSVYNNTAVIGAFLDDDKGTNSGSAYVFEKNSTSGNWTQTKLLATNAADDWFGHSVSVYNNTAVIGAFYDDDNGLDSGAAYIFERDHTGSWTQTKLPATNAAGDWFGWSVSVYNNTAVIGAFLDGDNGSNSGSAYVFERDSTGSWTQKEKLTASDGAADDWFGHSVSVYNNTAVIGAPFYDGINSRDSGAAYIFERDRTGSWTQIKLPATNAAHDSFGYSVSVYNNTAVIGAYRDDDNGSSSGSAYVFEKNSTGHWPQKEKLLASDGAKNDWFGHSVSVYDNTAVIGAYRDDDNGSSSGSAYVFEKNSTSGNWTQTETVKLTASDGAKDDYFGRSVSVYNNTAVIGAFYDDDKGTNSGSAYVFSVDTTSPTLQNITISSSNTNSTLAANGDTVTLSFTASESIKDVTATIGNATATVSGSDTSWTAALTLNKITHSSLNGISPSFTIDFADLAGNNGAQVTEITGGPAVTVDFTAPTLVIATTATGPTSLEPIPFTVDFGENMTSGEFAAAEITLSSGTVTDFTPDSANRLFTFNAADADDGEDLTVDVAANVATDLAGNNNTAADQLSVAVDRTAPTPVITTTAADYTNLEPVPFTVNFGENMTSGEFAAAEITLSSGTVTDFTPDSANRLFTFNAADADDGEDLTVDVAANVATDLAGNNNTAADQLSVAVDRTAPTPVITTTAADYTNLEPVPFTVNFGENMTSGEFAAAEITLSSGTVTDFTPDSANRLFTFNAANADDGEDLTVDVPANVATDLAGNNNTAADRLSVTVDRTSPTLQNVTISSNNTNSTLAANGDTVTLSFTASESIADVTATIGNAAATVSGSGTSWNATRTLNGTEPQGALPFTINFDDLAGNSGAQVSATTDGSAVTVIILDTDGSGVTNQTPTANAGDDQTVGEGTKKVTLDGTGSTDPDGDTITYAWSQTRGPTVTLSSSTSASPTFIAPLINSTQTILTFFLTVNDGAVDSTPDTVDITVLDTDDALLTFPGSPPGSSGGGGGGGSGGGGGGSSSSTWVDDIYLKSVSWDCNAGTIKIIAGPDSDYLSISVRTTQLGVHQASIAGDDIPGYRAFVSNMDKTEDYIGIKAVALHGRDSITISESINITECTGERTFDEYMQPESTLTSAVTQTEEEGQETIFDSPLYQQLKGDIPAEMVQCNEGLVLVLKPNMEESACVRESTAHKLVMRGWHGMS